MLPFSFLLPFVPVSGGVFYKLLLRIFLHYSEKYALFVYPEMKIGYGVYLGHGFNTLANSRVTIGNNVNLSHGVTLGTNTSRGALVGNNVYIGPNVCIVGECRIGDNVTIGAGSVVTKDVHEGKTVAGVPVKVLGVNHMEYIGNPLSFEEFKKMIR